MGDHESELSEFWGGYEAAIGFRSTFSAMLAAHAGVSMGSGSYVDRDPYAGAIAAIGRGNKVYRALCRMGTDDLVVLWRLFGPRHPSYAHDALGALAPVAVLTDAAEAARVDLVLEQSTLRSDVAGERVAIDLVRQRREIERMFWEEVGTIARAAERHGRTRSPARAAELARRVTAGWELLAKLLDAFNVDGSARARIGTISSTDREITVETAVRARLRARDAAFAAAVLREAIEMRNDAMVAYRRARAEEQPRRKLTEECVKATTEETDLAGAA